jgi:hypothetical protein
MALRTGQVNQKFIDGGLQWPGRGQVGGHERPDGDPELLADVEATGELSLPVSEWRALQKPSTSVL